MEDAIRDIFPYGPAEMIIEYSGVSHVKRINEELMGKVKRGERLLYKAWHRTFVYVQNGCMAYQIARGKFNDLWRADYDKDTNGDCYLYLVQGEDFSYNKRTPLISWKCFKPENELNRGKPLKKRTRFTRQLLIDYLTDNGFTKIKSKSKQQLIKLTQTF